ncbi:MAG: hypothetical protein JWO49_3077, partial [Arthrobacter sp.]|nr:hypothetical protein [Arthrobacter sp.]
MEDKKFQAGCFTPVTGNLFGCSLTLGNDSLAMKSYPMVKSAPHRSTTVPSFRLLVIRKIDPSPSSRCFSPRGAMGTDYQHGGHELVKKAVVKAVADGQSKTRRIRKLPCIGGKFDWIQRVVHTKCGSYRDRTDDIHGVNVALYQLS